MKQVFAWLLIVATLLISACGRQEENFMVGTLERDRIELKAETDEPIVAIAVEDGASVDQGAVLIRQDTRRQQARLDAATAQRDQAAARLAELRRGPRQEAIREAQARLAASEVLTRDAKAEFERVSEVFERGLSTASSRDSALTQFEASRAREQADREALAALLNGTTVEELQQAQAALDGAEASVRQSEIALERLTITAPLDGRIDKVLVKLGERPAPGTPLAVLLDTARTYARIYVPAHLKASLQVGTRLDIRLDGVEKPYRGTVSWVSTDASFTPYFALTEHDRSRLAYLAEVDIDDAAGLPSGLPLEARLPAAKLTD